MAVLGAVRRKLVTTRLSVRQPLASTDKTEWETHYSVCSTVWQPFSASVYWLNDRSSMIHALIAPTVRCLRRRHFHPLKLRCRL